MVISKLSFWDPSHVFHLLSSLGFRFQPLQQGTQRFVDLRYASGWHGGYCPMSLNLNPPSISPKNVLESRAGHDLTFVLEDGYQTWLTAKATTTVKVSSRRLPTPPPDIWEFNHGTAHRCASRSDGCSSIARKYSEETIENSRGCNMSR